MSDLTLAAAPARAHLIERLRPKLGECVPGFHLIAEGLLAAEERIDFIGVEPTGRIVLILVGDEGDDIALIGTALAHRAWVEPRVRDWIQLAPMLGARPGAGIRALLLCPDFSQQTLSAADALGDDVVALARYRCVRNGSDLGILLEPSSVAQPRVQPVPGPSSPEATSSFRTGLTDEDLGLSAAERESLG